VKWFDKKEKKDTCANGGICLIINLITDNFLWDG